MWWYWLAKFYLSFQLFFLKIQFWYVTVKVNSDALEYTLHSGKNSLIPLSISQTCLNLTPSEMSVKTVILSCNITFQLKKKKTSHINTVKKIKVIILNLEMKSLEYWDWFLLKAHNCLIEKLGSDSSLYWVPSFLNAQSTFCTTHTDFWWYYALEL